jgi:hypothetical protein
MCYSIAEGGLRCDSHAKEKKDKALTAFHEDQSEQNRVALTEAVQAWRLTKAGIDELRAEAEAENDDEKRRDADRCQRMRDRKLAQAAALREAKRKASGKPGTLKDKLRLASDASTDHGMQEILAKDKSEKVRFEVARNSEDSGVLDLLWLDSDPKVLAAVAKNPHTDAPALEALFDISSKHPGTAITLALAGNENCPKSLYLPLALRGSTQIRTVLARRADVDAQTLELIAEDASPAARRAAGMSTNGSRKVFVTLGCQDPETFVRSGVASNPAVPTDILQWIQTNDPDWHVREVAGETLATVAASEADENKAVA